MKVAIIVPIVGNFGRKGFYHSQEIGLGKEIASYGHEVTVYKCVPNKVVNRTETEKHDGITIHYIPTKAIGPHGLLDVTLVDKNTDVAFSFSDTQFVIPKLYRYCKKNRICFIPYVGIAHSFQQNLKSKLMDMLFRLTTLKVYKKVTVVAKTKDAQEELKKLGVKKCIVAPVGMDYGSLKQDYESFDRVELRRKWGFSKDDVIISFVARMQPEKHPLEMLEIFSNVQRKNKKLLMVGKGPLESKIREKVVELGIEDKVTLISEVKYDEMWQIHYIADYFVNLRPEEIFGMAIMEAVYYKSCVVAIKAPGPNTILENMNGHYLCDNYSEIVCKLEQETNKENLSVSMNKLKTNFTWKVCTDSIENIVEKEKRCKH